MIETFWNSFKAKWPPNRAAVALCALVAGPLAIAGGDVAAWSATHFPGLHLTAGQVTAAFIAGVAAVALPLCTAAYKWFGGWIQGDAHKQELERLLVREQGVDPTEAKAQVDEAHA
jgi:hypothetical protein